MDVRSMSEGAVKDGVTADDPTLASDTIDILCDLCIEDNQQVTATGYCVTCVQNLCQNCVKAHGKNKASKLHKVIKDNEQNKKSKKVKNVKCAEHAAEDVRFYCVVHDAVLCANCITQSHPSCKVVYINDQLEQFQQTQGHRKAIQALDVFEMDVEQCKRKLVAKMTQSDQILAAAEEDFDKFQKAFYDMFEREGKRVLEQMKNLHSANRSQLQTSITECDKFLGKTSESRLKLDKYEARPFAQFVKAKTTNKDMIKMQSALETLQATDTLSYYSFLPQNVLRQMLTSSNTIGEVKQSDIMGRKITCDIDFDVTTADDKMNCCIMGCDLLGEDLLILMDSPNKSVKILDIKLHKVIMTRVFNSLVFDVTTIVRDQAAITVPERNIIQFIQIGRKISTGHQLKVNGECHGIHHHDQRLYVTYPRSTPPKLEILTLSGEILRTVCWTGTKEEIFKWPHYVTVSDAAVFVSDTNKQQIIKLSLQGEVISTYEDKELGGPAGLATTGDGYILVCCNYWQRYNIQVINTDCRKLGTLLDHHNDLKQPFCVQFCQTSRTVYVGRKYKNLDMGGVKMFKFS